MNPCAFLPHVGSPRLVKSLLLTAACILGLQVESPLAAQDVAFAALLKGQSFLQTQASLAGLPDQDVIEDLQLEPVLTFEVFAEGMQDDSLLSGSVAAPGGRTLVLARDHPFDSELLSMYSTNNLLDLNTQRPDGLHTITLNTRNDGVQVIELELVGGQFPPVPLVTNYAALQAIVTDQDTVVQWSPMNGTTNDFIRLNVMDTETRDDVFESQMPGEPGALDGTSTQVVIPAGVLQPGRDYRAELYFVKVVDVDVSVALAVAGYFKQVTFRMRTQAAPGTPLGAAFAWASPGSYQSWVPRDSVVAFAFSHAMSPTHRWIEWTRDDQPLDPGSFSYEWTDGNTVLLCRSLQPLAADAKIGWTLHLSGFRDAAGFALSGNESGEFQTSMDDPETPPDVEFVALIKQRFFTQTGAAPVSNGMWGYEVEVDMPAYNRVKQATVTLPGGGASYRLERDPWGDELELEGTYADAADLNRFFPNGVYTVTLDTVADGVHQLELDLGAVDAYPAAPTFTNLAALQAIDPDQPFAIEWLAPPNWQAEPTQGSTLIGLEITNSRGWEVYWADHEDLDSAAGHLVPAGVLSPGRSYEVSLYFTHITHLAESSYPGVMTGAGFESETRATIQVAGMVAVPRLAVELQQGGVARVVATPTDFEVDFYLLESSQNLQRWLPRTGIWLGAGPAEFYDPDAFYFFRRFYRLREIEPGEDLTPHVAIQGRVMSSINPGQPVAGAIVGTSLDGRVAVTGPLGGFFLETDTRAYFAAEPYSITVTVGSQSKTYGPLLWGDQPRGQQLAFP